jgi:hypothetical protein
MYRITQRLMLIINNIFLSVYDYNFLLVNENENEHHIENKKYSDYIMFDQIK